MENQTTTRGKQITLSITKTTVIIAIITLLIGFGAGFGVQTLIGGNSDSTNQQMPSGNRPSGNFGEQQNGASDDDNSSNSNTNAEGATDSSTAGATATDTLPQTTFNTTAVAA